MKKPPLVKPHDFSHAIRFDQGDLSESVVDQQTVYAHRSRPSGFAKFSTLKGGKLISAYEDFRISGGLLTGLKGKIYTPQEDAMVRVDGSSREVLIPRKDDLFFGVNGVHALDSILAIRSMDGLHLYDPDKKEVLASFVNYQMTSTIRFLYDSLQSKLYIAGMRDKGDPNSILIAVDLADDYKILWKKKIEGECFFNGGSPPEGRFALCQGLLTYPVVNSDLEKWTDPPHWLEARDPETGELVQRIETHSIWNFYSTGERIILQGYQKDKFASINPRTAEVDWISDIPGPSHHFYGPIRVLNGKLYLNLKIIDTKSWRVVSIDIQTGEVQVLEKHLNFFNAYAPDGTPGQPVYVVDEKWICW